MCSIFGSFDFEIIKSLSKLNSYRGSHSYSYSIIDSDFNITVSRGFGALPLDDINPPDNSYILCHQQAPTTEAKDEKSIHPSYLKDEYLWHNGILKEKTISELQKELDDYSEWDTHLLLKLLQNNISLDNIDGSFSCVYYKNKKLFLFRNSISPLFIDHDMNISSTKFNNSFQTPENSIIEFNPFAKTTDIIKYFNNISSPYYFGE